MKNRRLNIIAVSIGLMISGSALAADNVKVLTQDELSKGFTSSTEGYKNTAFNDSSAKVAVLKTTSSDLTGGKFGIFLSGTSSEERASSTIVADTLTFVSDYELKDSDLTDGTLNNGSIAGLNHFAVWQAGNSDLTIDVKRLEIGSNERSGDRGFQFKGENNTLTIYADEIVAYMGDGFVNAQGVADGAASTVTIGSVSGL